MDKRKVWKVLAACEKPTRKKFTKWIAIQEKVGPEASSLAEELNRIIDKKKAISDEALWGVLFKDKAYNDAKWRKLCATIYVQLKKFLAIENFLQDDRQVELHTVKALNLLNLPGVFEEEHKAAMKNLEKKEFIDGTYFRKLYELELEFFRHQQRSITSPKKLRIVELNEAFDAWWMHEKMGLACSNTSYASVFGDKISDLNFPLESTFDKIKKQKGYENMHTYRLFKELFFHLNGQPSRDPGQIQQDLMKHKNLLRPKVIFSMIAMLANILVRKINKDKSENDIELLIELYAWGIDEKYFFQNGYLPAEYCKNLIALCLKLKDMKRAHLYLEKYKSSFPEEVRMGAYRLNRALILFAEKDFNAALQMLTHKFSNIFREQNAKVMLLETRLELSTTNVDREAIRVQADSFIRNLYNLQLNDTYKKLFRIRVRFLIRLLKIMEQPTEKGIKSLKDAIDREQFLNNKPWLLNKIEEIAA